MMQDKNKVSRTVTPDEVVKIGSLLKVFSTVIKSLGEDFDANKSRLMTMSYFLEVGYYLQIYLTAYMEVDLEFSVTSTA